MSDATMHRKAAIVGVGASGYFRRGGSAPLSSLELAYQAILAAVADAGLTPEQVDGFAYFGPGADTALVAQTLGMDEIRFTAGLTGGGGGSAGSVGLAAAAIVSGLAEVVVSVVTLQQGARRLGGGFGPQGPGREQGVYNYVPTPEKDFTVPYGLVGPGQAFAILTSRHMHRYGTTREHFAEIVLSTRENARNREQALMREPLTLDDYFAGRMIADPLCVYDFCLETEGAVAVVTTSAERARDLPHPPAYVLGSAQGGPGRWGQMLSSFGASDDSFASSGARTLAQRLYAMAGVGPADIDVAEIYDHFSPMVIMQLEDYGFCEIGEGGPFVAAGNIRFGTGSLPVNTHGGNLSEAYIIGMTHVMEAVEQLRGTAVNQVEGAEVALVTGGPSGIPTSSLILGR